MSICVVGAKLLWFYLLRRFTNFLARAKLGLAHLLLLLGSESNGSPNRSSQAILTVN